MLRPSLGKNGNPDAVTGDYLNCCASIALWLLWARRLAKAFRVSGRSAGLFGRPVARAAN